MSKSNLTPATLRSMNVGETMTVNGVDRSIVSEATRALTDKNPGYLFSVSKNRKGEVLVKRIVPEGLGGVASYINTLTKKAVVTALRNNDNVRTYAAEQLGISRRSLGRVMQRLGIN